MVRVESTITLMLRSCLYNNTPISTTQRMQQHIFYFADVYFMTRLQRQNVKPIDCTYMGAYERNVVGKIP